jgi:serine/threonine protein kinase
MKIFEVNFLDPEKARDIKEGIFREIDIMRKLSHQNILKIEDLVLHNDSPVIIMELCDGNLEDYIKERKDEEISE